MMTTHKIDIYAPLSETDKKLLKEAMKEDVTYDEDCPPLTDSEIKMFQKAAAQRRERRNKQTVTKESQNASVSYQTLINMRPRDCVVRENHVPYGKSEDSDLPKKNQTKPN